MQPPKKKKISHSIENMEKFFGGVKIKFGFVKVLYWQIERPFIGLTSTRLRFFGDDSHVKNKCIERGAGMENEHFWKENRELLLQIKKKLEEKLVEVENKMRENKAKTKK